RWEAIASASGLLLDDFDGGVELKAAGINKGFAVQVLLGETPHTVPVAYLGDDKTDEDAFIELADRGLGVLVRAEARPTAASVWLRPPEELLDFLERWRQLTASAALP